MSTRTFTHHLPALAWTLLLAWLLTIPADCGCSTSAIEEWVIGWSSTWMDIAAHFGLFGVMAWLWARSLKALGMRGSVPIAILLATAFGLALEIAQAFVPGRGTEGLDVIVNGLGATTFGWLGGRG